MHHFVKTGGRSVEAAIGGAGAITRVPRAVLLFGKPGSGWRASSDAAETTEGIRILASHKLNVGAIPPSLAFELEERSIASCESVIALKEVGETLASADDVFQAAAVNDDPSGTLDQAITFLLNFLIDGPERSADVRGAAREAAIGWRTIERARAKMGVVAFQEGAVWWLKLPELPDQPPDQPPGEWS